jgi:hypothetical protein
MAKQSSYTIRTIWGLAKSPELHLNDEEVHMLVSRETGKESLKELNKKEITVVVTALMILKDSVKKKLKKDIISAGNPITTQQRQKIYMLTTELDWDNNKSRINGFVKKMFKVECVDWLDSQQCSVLIESLKKMVDRKKKEESANASKANCN